MKYRLNTNPSVVVDIDFDGDLACILCMGNITMTTERYVNCFFERAWDLEPDSQNLIRKGLSNLGAG